MLLHRLLHALNALLLIALFAYAATYSALPDRIPRHFDAAGRADAWVEKLPVAVFMMPLVALGCVGICYASARMITGRPDLVNVPGKTPFQQWPVEAQQRLYRDMQTYLYATAAGLVALFGVVAASTVEAAHTGVQPAYVLFAILAFLVLSILATSVLIYRVYHQPRR